LGNEILNDYNKFKAKKQGIIGEKAGRVLPLCKASSGYTRKNWVGFHIWNIIADSKTILTSDFLTGEMLPKREIRN
jgi:hypothetical protein